MTDTLLESGDGDVIGISDKIGTSIPYKAEVREDGNVNNGFLDLRGKPHLVDQIPEVHRSRGFANILRAANQPHSLNSP